MAAEIGDDAVRVFISYSRADGAFTDRLHAALRESGVDAYLDRHDIAPGEDWRARLGALIEAADAIVFVLSPDSAASETCGWEVAHAAELSKRLLPVVRRDVDPAALPEALATRNFVFMRCDTEADAAFDGLRAALAVDIDWVRAQTRYGERALEWDRAGRPSRLLLRGEDVAAAESWRDARPASAPDLSELQRAYLFYLRAVNSGNSGAPLLHLA